MADNLVMAVPAAMANPPDDVDNDVDDPVMAPTDSKPVATGCGSPAGIVIASPVNPAPGVCIAQREKVYDPFRCAS